MRVVITAATEGEWKPAAQAINPLYTGSSSRLQVRFHRGGVGLLATAFSLGRLIGEEKPDLIIQAGIAGCFDANIPLSTVLVIGNEYLGDTGVEENGRWRDLFDLQLEQPSNPPFEQQQLPNPWLPAYNLLQLPEVTAVSINTITTRPERIQQLVEQYNPVTESMEGAALHYVCRQTHTPFIQIRSTSNYIGIRDKTQWKIKEAIGNLNQTLLQYVEQLYKRET